MKSHFANEAGLPRTKMRVAVLVCLNNKPMRLTIEVKAMKKSGRMSGVSSPVLAERTAVHRAYLPQPGRVKEYVDRKHADHQDPDYLESIVQSVYDQLEKKEKEEARDAYIARVLKGGGERRCTGAKLSVPIGAAI